MNAASTVKAREVAVSKTRCPSDLPQDGQLLGDDETLGVSNYRSIFLDSLLRGYACGLSRLTKLADGGRPDFLAKTLEYGPRGTLERRLHGIRACRERAVWTQSYAASAVIYHTQPARTNERGTRSVALRVRRFSELTQRDRLLAFDVASSVFRGLKKATAADAVVTFLGDLAKDSKLIGRDEKSWIRLGTLLLRSEKDNDDWLYGSTPWGKPFREAKRASLIDKAGPDPVVAWEHEKVERCWLANAAIARNGIVHTLELSDRSTITSEIKVELFDILGNDSELIPTCDI